MRSQNAFEREPARRVFASEFRETRYQFKEGDDEKSPTYVLLPSGIRSNRVFIVGTLTERQRHGDQNLFYRGRVIDPTGTFFIMAGSYQPEAMQQLARIEPPVFVAVVGKPNLYMTPDGACLVSIRAESISVVDRETRDIWVLDTARDTLDRLDALGTTGDSRRAQEEYGTQPDIYRKIVYDALTQVQL
ncbi:MAG: nucleic acid-binding protein [Methanoculleus sp.]|jgi:RPA family protein|nr:nucleic acid-binding protein [Methanomicrobiales archaeon]